MENSVDCRQEMLLAEAEAVGAKRARENERDRPRGSSYRLVAVMSSYGRINPNTSGNRIKRDFNTTYI